MQHELDYLRREMEFLKKFLAKEYREVGALFMKESSSIFEIIYTTVTQGRERLSVSALCEIAGVSRSGYYAWVRAASPRNILEEQDRKNFDLVLVAYRQHGYSKGAKIIYMALLHMDSPVVMNLKKYADSWTNICFPFP